VVDDVIAGNGDRLGRLHPIAERINEHFDDFVTGIDRPAVVVGRSDHLGIGLLVLVQVEASFARRQRTHEKYRPGAMPNGRERRHGGDIRRYSAPVPRQILGDLTIQGDRGIVEESCIDFVGLID
jgi:hypothetical protein